MNEEFVEMYLGKWDIKPLPRQCPYCGKNFKHWRYEKTFKHLTQCTRLSSVKKVKQ